MTEKYGVPVWASFVLFGVVVILLGLLLGMVKFALFAFHYYLLLFYYLLSLSFIICIIQFESQLVDLHLPSEIHRFLSLPSHTK